MPEPRENPEKPDQIPGTKSEVPHPVIPTRAVVAVAAAAFVGAVAGSVAAGSMGG